MKPAESNSQARAGGKGYLVHHHQAQHGHLMTVEVPHMTLGSCGAGEEGPMEEARAELNGGGSACWEVQGLRED